MKITILGSGSKGNSVLVEIKDKKILLDAGFSYKELKNRLEKIKVYPKDIDYIFISHDHSDHISALKVFLNHNNPDVYISKKIADLYSYIAEYKNVHFLEDDLYFDDFDILLIPTSHDATSSNGYIITEYESNESLVYLTDTGYINQRNFKFLENREYYIFESNHDTDMLIKGKYPPHLQRRILSPIGHLSNIDSSIYLSKFIGNKTKKIILAHLSEENNREDVAISTFKKVMIEENIDFTNVSCAKQDEIVVIND